MKRDCGNGELVPVKYEVVYCVGEHSDDEIVLERRTFNEAKEVFQSKLPEIQATRCSNLRLYALDKQGYANCIISYTHCKNGEKTINDRTNEL